MKKQILIILIAFLFLIPTTSGLSLNKNNSSKINSLDSSESYLIEGVPYIAQQEFGCAYASLAMMFNYLGRNTSMMKNYYFCGAGHSFAYPRTLKSIVTPPIVRPPYFFQLLSSGMINQGTEDWAFMGELNGAEFYEFYTEENIVINHFKAWNKFWADTKNFIKNDNPVMAAIDPLAWPIFQEYLGINKTPLFGRGGHAIVIVGFNEENNTICIQDPMAGSPKWYVPNRSGYQWIDLKVFRKAVSRSFWDLKQNSYYLFAITNLSEEPDFDYAFRMAHNRNIEKLKGNVSAYDSVFMAPQFKEFGVNAIKKLREEYQSSRFYLLYPFFKIMAKLTGPANDSMPFGWSSGWHKHEGAVQREISKFLYEIKPDLENESLREICDYEAALFKNESLKFYELSNTTFKLQELFYGKFIIKAFSEAKVIIEDIVEILDEIIAIQEAIIAGPPED